MTSTNGTTCCPRLESEMDVARTGPSAWRRLYLRVRRWQRLRHERQQLWSLSDATLKDIGLSRADIEREASRPFWDDSRWGR